MDNEIWNNDSIQFPRLLAEIRAIGLPDETIKQLTASMDLEEGHIMEILERAERRFEEIKPLADSGENPPGLYRVLVNRIAHSNMLIDVDFDGVGNLENIAIDIAGDFISRTYHSTNYDVESCQRLGDRQKNSSSSYYRNEEGKWIEIQRDV